MAKTIYPDIQKIITNIENADNDDDKARDSRELYKLLRKMPDYNPRISGHILTRNTAVSSYGWKIVPKDDTAIDRAAEVQARLKSAIDFLINRHAATHAYGHQVYDVSFNVVDGVGQVPTISPWDITRSECHKGKFFEYLEDGSKRRVDADMSKLLDSSESSNSNGGILRSILMGEKLRMEALAEQSKWLAKLKGVIQIINKGGDGDEQAAAEEAARTAVKDGGFTSSDLIEMKLNTIAQGNNSFKDAIEAFNSDIAIAFLGQANTTELPNYGGSRAGLQIQRLVSDDITFSDITHFEKFINEQLLKYDNQLNYGDQNINYAFVVDTQEYYNAEDSAIAVREKLATGLPFLKKEIYAELRMTIPDAADDVVQLNSTMP